MNCDGVRDLLSAYVDGEATPGELLRVEQHLRRCPVCAEEVDALRQTIAMVASLEEVELPPGFREGLRARLAEVSAPVQPVLPVRPAWGRNLRRWALPAAAAAALALASSGVYNQVAGILNRTATETRPPVMTPDLAQTTDVVATGPIGTNDGAKGKDQGSQSGNANGSNPGKETGSGKENVSSALASGKDAPKQSDGPSTKPSVQPDPTPVGPGTGVPATGEPALASFAGQVPKPAKLPAKLTYITTVRAVVPDQVTACNGLKNAFQASCTTKDAGKVQQAIFAVPQGQAQEAQQEIARIVGEGMTAQTVSIDRALQFSQAYERLTTIDVEVEKLQQVVATSQDAVERANAQEQLAQKLDEGKEAVRNYNNLLAEVTSHTFVVELEKQGQ
jgi:hypothetical protein